MGKPLLTDEIIERAKRGEEYHEGALLEDKDETKVILTSSNQSANSYDSNKTKSRQSHLFNLWGNRQKDQHIYKSRRIENAKRGEFQRKLNLIMLTIFILIVILFFAVFNW